MIKFFFVIVVTVLFLSSCNPLEETYQEVTKPKEFNFPKDHGAHPSFKTEWWYFTGHLQALGKNIFKELSDFGFQLTFFRVEQEKSKPFLIAHSALSDIKNQKFYHDQRYALFRSGLGFFSDENFDLKVHEWEGNFYNDQVNLKFSTKGCRVNLNSPSLPKVILQGKNGLSKKSPELGKASYYYSIPQIKLKGYIECRNQSRIEVAGLAWMDHEFMTQALSDKQVGWDWFSLMKEDGSSLMLFKLRGKNPKDDFYSGTYIDSHNNSYQLFKEDFKIESLEYWQSTNTTANYPIKFKIEVPRFLWNLTIKANIIDQEVVSQEQTTPSYWEGAVSSEDNLVKGYAELTGYDKPIGNRF